MFAAGQDNAKATTHSHVSVRRREELVVRQLVRRQVMRAPKAALASGSES